jgi:hypothetical protein
MRHGKREGDNAPKPVPERQGTQTRAKQTDNANDNGTSHISPRDTRGIRNRNGQRLTKHSFPGSRRRI